MSPVPLFAKLIGFKDDGEFTQAVEDEGQDSKFIITVVTKTMRWPHFIV